MDSREVNILTDRMIPVPRECRFSDGKEYLLEDKCPITLQVEETDQVPETAETLCRAFWNIRPALTVKQISASGMEKKDAYRIRISARKFEIAAKGIAGIRNAFLTLRQLAEVRRGTEKTEGYFLVPCEIRDEPALEFRGIHLCIFPETPLWDIEKMLRIAAYHNFNYAVIETWGVFPFASHPEFCWADKKVSRNEIKRLVKLGKELGITRIPQFNLLGHASGSRSMTGKHAILDANPALQVLFEPDGWTWCLSNPHTRRIQTDLVLELYELFDCPPFFHIGCDEAENIATCRECRKADLKELVRDHIVYFRDLFKQRGARVIMWHDMLLERDDERWKGYIVCGLPQLKLGTLYKELPKDIIIADWQYGYKAEQEDPEPEWPTAEFFKKEKFDVLVCPWTNEDGMRSLGEMAQKKNLFGMLETTWHIFHDFHFLAVTVTAATAAWNPEKATYVTASTRLAATQHMRQVVWDMGIVEYEKTGWSQYQVDAGHHPHPLH